MQLNAGGMNVEENGERVGEGEQAAPAGCFEEDGERTKEGERRELERVPFSSDYPALQIAPEIHFCLVCSKVS